MFASERHAAAHHEAGHATAGDLLGLFILEAVLHPGLSCGGRVSIADRPISGSTVSVETALIYGLAGPVAESAFLGYSPRLDDFTPWSTDRKWIQELLVARNACGVRSVVDLPPLSSIPAVVAAMESAERLLRQNWAAVEAVARVLLTDGRVTGDGVRAALRNCERAELAELAKLELELVS